MGVAHLVRTHIAMMQASSRMLVVVFLFWKLCMAQNLRCFRNELISLDRKLLPLTNIRALHADQLAYPVENIVESSMVWCSTAGNGGVNYVNMTFSKPVVLEGLISHGATSNMGTIQHYVSGFSILYSKAENGSLQLYPSNFTAMSPETVYEFINSIAGVKFQFRVYEFTSNPFFCWQLHLIGCLMASAQPQAICSTTPPAPTPSFSLYQSSLTKPQPASMTKLQLAQTQCSAVVVTSVTTVTVLSSCGLGGSPAPQQSSAAAGLVGGGVVVLLVGVVLIITAIVLTGVVLAIWKRRKSTASEELQRKPTIVQIDNTALYDISTSRDEATLSNKVYEGSAAADNDDPEYAAVQDYEQPIQTIQTAPNQSYRALGSNDETGNQSDTSTPNATGHYESPTPRSAVYEDVSPPT